MEKRGIRFVSKYKIKTSFYASPIEDEILQEMGIEPGYDLEKMIDELVMENFMVDDEKSHFCSIHKAVVPIARMSSSRSRLHRRHCVFQMPGVFEMVNL